MIVVIENRCDTMRFLHFFILAFSLVPIASQAAESAESARFISVDGQGIVEAVPDMAVVQVGVRREAASASQAMEWASEGMTAVLEQIAEAGIPPEDVQTTRIGLDTRWQHSQDGTPPWVTGYVASNDLSLKVRNLTLLGALLDAIVADGANSMSGLYFALSDPAPLEKQAREAAVLDATEKARTLAGAARETLGEVMSITEGAGGGGPVPMFETAISSRAAVPVAAGQIAVVVSIRAVFALGE